MKTEIRPPLLACVALLSSSHVMAACESAAGNWSYSIVTPYINVSYTFNLTQSLVGTLSGPGTVSFCQPPPVYHTGQVTGNGQFSVHTDPGWGTTGCQGATWTATVQKPGCNTASGHWRNDDGLGQGDFVWTKPCDIPTGESTSPGGWSAEGTTFIWNATLGPSSVNFGGRTIHESVSTTDSCWFSGSAISQQTGVEGNPADINSSNGFQDDVGWLSFAVTYYRNQGRAPCGFSSTQRMFIDCSAGPVSYIVNGLAGAIGATTVSSSRQGQTQTRTWP